MNWRQIFTGFVLITTCVVARLLPHPPNFAPIAAAALFAGTFARPRFCSLAVPLVSMFIGDCFIGFYDWKTMGAVYFGLAVPPIITATVLSRYRLGIVGVLFSSLFSSIGFFVVSNLAVWAFWTMYSHDVKGLGECFIAALPFFGNTALGDICWSGIFFGSYLAFRNRAFIFNYFPIRPMKPIER